MKYNFKESYLTESFFDDIEDDIYSDNNELETISYDTVLIPYLKEYQNKLQPKIKLSYNTSAKLISIDLLYINDIYNDSFDNFLEYWDTDLLQGWKVIISSQQKNYQCFSFQRQSAIYDFKNIPILLGPGMFIGFGNVNIKNLNIVAESDFCGDIYFHDCIFPDDNNISVMARKITINQCFNIKDFSFIKPFSLFKELWFNYKLDNTCPQTYNLTGLPSTGRYSVYIKPYILSYLKNGIFSFIGLPSTAKIAVEIPNIKMIEQISLEGLTGSYQVIHFDIYKDIQCYTKIYTADLERVVPVATNDKYSLNKNTIDYMLTNKIYTLRQV